MIDPSELIAFARQQSHKFARKRHLPRHEWDDCEQEAVLASLKAQSHYRPERGPWQPLMAVAIRRKLDFWYHRRQMVRPCYSQRSKGYPAVFLKGIIGSVQGAWDVPEPEGRAQEDAAESLSLLREMIRVIPRIPSRNHKAVFVQLLAGESLLSISRRLGVTSERVRQIRNSLHTLRTALEAAA